MPEKSAHLQMIQGIISRMAQNSFSLKGWAVTLIAALFALSAKDTDVRIAFVAFVPAFTFWALDAYYLQQERLFRVVYNYARKIEDANVDYAIDVKAALSSTDEETRKTTNYGCCLFSVTEGGFYLPLLVVITTAIVLFCVFRPPLPMPSATQPATGAVHA